jgi:hypothetical protein
MVELSPKYPVGMQSFSEIREEGYLYVDKTDLVYKLVHGSKSIFLSRPRRFGKSLLVSTLQSYFEGRKELFSGLFMEDLEKEWTTYPVLRFDFGGAKGITVQDLRDKLSFALSKYERIYGGCLQETSLGNRFSELIQRASEQTGKRVVLLIDEYDVPMLEVLHKPEQIEGVRAVMRDFYSQIKPNDEYLRFVFITGISTFSQLGMFSELNSLKNITERGEYAAVCGVTPQELVENFSYGIHQFATSCNCTPEEVVRNLREQYDGYHFTKEMIDVFNPYSLLSAFDGGHVDDYWFRTGTPTFVIEMLKKHQGDWKFEIEDVEETGPMSLSDFNIPLEQADDPIPFLYQAGYLTIKSYDARSNRYMLGVPNTEVRIGLLRNLIPLYSLMNPKETYNVATDVTIAFCDGDYDKALRLIQSFMAGIPFMPGDEAILKDQLRCEAYYHRMIFIILGMLHNGARAQVRQAVGMPDVVVQTSRYIYIIEVKFDSSAEKALQQIEEKHYAAPYLADKREIIKLGVNFSSKNRTLSEWQRGS